MKIVKVKLPELPLKKKTYEVKTNVKNMRKTYAMQLAFAKNSDMDNKDDVEIIKDVLASLNDAIDYVQEMLGLSDDDIDKIIDELGQTDIINVANIIAMQLMGIKQEDTEEESKKN